MQLTVQSANGALKRDGGTDTVAYEVIWNIQNNPVASGNASAWIVPFGFTLLSGTNGAEQLGAYAVKIVGPDRRSHRRRIQGHDHVHDFALTRASAIPGWESAGINAAREELDKSARADRSAYPLIFD